MDNRYQGIVLSKSVTFSVYSASPHAPATTNLKILMKHPGTKIAEPIILKIETRGKIILDKTCSSYCFGFWFISLCFNICTNYNVLLCSYDLENQNIM